MREAAQRWATVWERGWREHDAAAIAALYAPGAFWQQHPFREPEPDYLARVFAEEESAQCQFGSPIVDGDQAAVPWSPRCRRSPGDRFYHELVMAADSGLDVGCGTGAMLACARDHGHRGRLTGLDPDRAARPGPAPGRHRVGRGHLAPA